MRDFLWWPSLKGLDLIQVCLTQSAQPLFPPRRNPQRWSEQTPSLCEAQAFRFHILRAKERSSSLPRSSSAILAGREGGGHARREGGTMRYELARCPASTSKGELPGTQARLGSLELTPFPCFPIYKGRAWTG